ncbi:hypothetical protein [Leptospira interrogans]|uniref:Uncharacterized protein n=2 Tax=Leptospira interrogans str. UI 12621 TaxID=1049937 RepID=A0A0F6HEB9_LEPIR|nr:hypothetical protein [Leptospira interrogans]EKO26687.1 hypothetical protein LEP1GSC104_3480 [Leptospira interrogans str. UI 12621]
MNWNSFGVNTPSPQDAKSQTLMPGFSLTDRKTVVCWSNVLKLLSSNKKGQETTLDLSLLFVLRP